jgi:hypothetical protein
MSGLGRIGAAQGGLHVTFQKPNAVARHCAPGAAPGSCCTRFCCNGKRHGCALAHIDRRHLLPVLAGLPVGSGLRSGPGRGLALGHANPRRSRRSRAQRADPAMQQRTYRRASASENSQAASGRTGHPPIKGCAAIPGKLQSGLEYRWMNRPGTQFTRRNEWAGLPPRCLYRATGSA